MAITDFGSFTLSGAAITNPTSLQIGPDGRLYVSEQSGSIKIFTITETASGYTATATETVNLVKNIPNHNDDGFLNTAIAGRQITGLLVTEDAAGKPVIYVGSSDPRIGAGPGGVDKNIDTNSGVITKLTQKAGGGWDAVDIIRGLPRSEENHSVNGLEINEATNELYITVGGNTNSGAPSNNFANTPEYALSAAILKVDLDAINAMPVKTDSQSNRKYIYDLPTLDDPTRPNVDGKDAGAGGSPDVWGGNNGMNQAKWVLDGPVQVYATGLRNSYDVVFHSNGYLYTIDNGANNGWGGRPLTPGNVPVTANNQIATDKPSDDTPGNPDGAFDPNNLDNLHVITGPNQYFGHPNPIRAWAEQAVYNPANAAAGPFNPKWTGIPVDIATVTPDMNGSFAGHNQKEGVFIQPGQGDGALYTWKVSTNGIVEYTSTVDPSLKGMLMTVGLGGKLTVLPVSADGKSVLTNQVKTLDVGGAPLDIWAQGDGQQFAGSIWVARYGTNDILILKPNSTGGGTTPPPDRDADGILDTLDRMPVDPNNGKATILGAGQTLVFDFNGQLPTAVPFDSFYKGAGFSGFGVSAGFTGIMKTNGELPEQLYNSDNIIAQGAANVFQIDAVSVGDAVNKKNSQENAFFMGLTPAANVGKFTYSAVMDNPLDLMTGSYQSQGIFIGTGDEDNYLKIIVGMNAFDKPFVQVGHEIAGVFSSKGYQLNIPAGSIKAADIFTVSLDIDAKTGLVTPKWSYTINNQATTVNGAGTAVQLSGDNLAALLGTYTVDGKASSLGYGIISTSFAEAPFAALWEKLTFTAGPPVGGGNPNAAAKVLINQNGTNIDASTYNAATIKVNNMGSVDIAKVEFFLDGTSLPDLVFDPADGSPAGDVTAKGFKIDVIGGTGVINPSDVNGSPPFSQPYKDGYKALSIDFQSGSFNPGETMQFSVDIDPTSIKGQAGSGSSGSISGAELTGATIKVTYADGTVQTSQMFGDGSNGGGEAYLKNVLAPALQLNVGGLDNGEEGALAGINQTVQVSGGPAGATVRVMVIEGAMKSVSANPPLSPSDPTYDANTAVDIDYYVLTLNSSGVASVNISSSLESSTDARYYVNAVVIADLDPALGGLEAAGYVDDPVVFRIDPFIA